MLLFYCPGNILSTIRVHNISKLCMQYSKSSLELGTPWEMAEKNTIHCNTTAMPQHRRIPFKHIDQVANINIREKILNSNNLCFSLYRQVWCSFLTILEFWFVPALGAWAEVDKSMGEAPRHSLAHVMWETEGILLIASFLGFPIKQLTVYEHKQRKGLTQWQMPF